MGENKFILGDYVKNEPIFIEDIIQQNPTRSRQWIDHELNNMVVNKQLKRYMTGVYFISSGTKLDHIRYQADHIIKKKYIERNGKVFGYYSGDTLLRKLKIPNDHSDVITIITNKEKSRGRKVTVGDREVYLIKPPTEITNTNYRMLTFLEAVRLIDFSNQERWIINNLEDYIHQYQITLSQAQKYCVYFPDAVSKKILGNCLIQALVGNEKDTLKFF